MGLVLEPYAMQDARWPRIGRHIIAQFDDDTVVVYQAYRPSIACFALEHGHFGGEFSFNRMSWIKPGFLWMMHRSGWGMKAGQEVVLAIRIRRGAFEQILTLAVHSTFQSAVYGSELVWRSVSQQSSVRLQWDPDHAPSGMKVGRRVIQLGLRGDILRRYAGEWIASIEDITEFAREQHRYVLAQEYSQLLLPKEEIYPIHDPALAARIQVEVNRRAS